MGGQALNYWISYFRPAELAARVFTSADVDFFGSAADAARASDILDGSVMYPPTDDLRSASSAVVTYRDAGGALRELDFVRRLAGLDAAEVDRTAVPADASFRVLNPYLCLKSRAANVIELARSDEHSLSQLRAAVLCMRGYLAQLFDETPRDFMKATERLAAYARTDLNALGAFHKHAIDVFAVPEIAHELFSTRRLPELRAQLHRERLRRAPRA